MCACDPSVYRCSRYYTVELVVAPSSSSSSRQWRVEVQVGRLFFKSKLRHPFYRYWRADIDITSPYALIPRCCRAYYRGRTSCRIFSSNQKITGPVLLT